MTLAFLLARKASSSAIFYGFSPRLVENPLISTISGRTLGVEDTQSPPGNQQIRQPEEGCYQHDHAPFNFEYANYREHKATSIRRFANKSARPWRENV